LSNTNVSPFFSCCQLQTKWTSGSSSNYWNIARKCWKLEFLKRRISSVDFCTWKRLPAVIHIARLRRMIASIKRVDCWNSMKWMLKKKQAKKHLIMKSCKINE
jgi:hypothetical protein